MKYVVIVTKNNKRFSKVFNNLVLASVYLYDEMNNNAILGTIHREDENDTIAICCMKVFDNKVKIIV